MMQNRNIDIEALLKDTVALFRVKDIDIDSIKEKYKNHKKITVFFNTIEKKKNTTFYKKKDVEKFIDKINDVLLSFAMHKFSENFKLTDDDIFDSLITALNLLGQELNNSTVTTHYLYDVFSSIGDIIIVVDKYGYVLYINETACDLLAYKKDDLKHENIAGFFEGDININDLINTKKTQKSLNFVSSTGKKIPVSIKISNFSRHDNPMMGYVLVARDMSVELKYQKAIEEKNYRITKANLSLKKALIKAEESDKLKSAFLSNISHEIRTPLNGIMGFAQLLMDSNVSDKKQVERYSRIIYESGEHLLAIMNNVLDMSKIEAGSLKLAQDEVDINIFMSKIFQIYQQKTLDINKNVVLVLDKERNDIKTIKTDEVRLKQILSNLLDNAFKFTYKGKIVLGYRKEGKNLIFHVKDTGIGIAENKLESVFKPFMQADNSLTRQHDGAGLGLAIASGLVKLFKGNIWVESKVDKGSTFYFTIPYCPVAKTNNGCKKEQKLNNYNWKGKHILLVEDDKASQLLYEYMLNPYGAKLVIIDNGKEALEYFENNRDTIDVILMDIKLPDLDGISVTKNIRSLNKNVRIIAQSAHTHPEERSKCIDAGCNAFTSKPITDKNILKLIDDNLQIR